MRGALVRCGERRHAVGSVSLALAGHVAAPIVIVALSTGRRS
ncbi:MULTISPECIES: hypothetical protein [unclassified Streptosporangium]